MNPSFDNILSIVCKELISARIAQSKAMIKLRVSSESEIELQETIIQRDRRITQLKQYIHDLKNAYSSLNGKTVKFKGKVSDFCKKDIKYEEILLELASKDAEIRYLKKKLAVQQSKTTIVYDITELKVRNMYLLHMHTTIHVFERN